MLLDAPGGCEMDALDEWDYSALFRACEGGHVEVVKLLLEKGAKWEAKHEKRFGHRASCLEVASTGGHLEVVS